MVARRVDDAPLALALRMFIFSAAAEPRDRPALRSFVEQIKLVGAATANAGADRRAAAASERIIAVSIFTGSQRIRARGLAVARPMAGFRASGYESRNYGGVMRENFPGPAYLICGDARTGSSLLASTLRTMQEAGKPLEYFGRAEIDKQWMREQLHTPDGEPFVSFVAWRDYILQAGSEYGGIFGASVHWFQAETLHDTFRQPGETLSLAATLRKFFPQLRLIRLRRRNLVAQGMSHYVAITNNIWNTTSAPHLKPGEHDVATPYDFDKIDEQVLNARLGRDGWRRELAEAQDITLPLTYEELAADLEGSVRRVLLHIGAPAEGPLRPYLQKQSGARSLEMERLYREERRARGLGPVGDEAEIG
jgi:LPS sulfotransferase NodH